MVNPCCGTSLQQGTKFLAMFSMMLSVTGIAISSYYLVTVILSSPKKDSTSDSDPDAVNDADEIFKLFFTLVGFVINLFLSILLFIGAEQKNLRLCEVWYKATICLFLMDLMIFVGSMFVSMADVTDIVINTSGIIYSIYELWVVYAFIYEIRNRKETISGCATVNTTV